MIHVVLIAAVFLLVYVHIASIVAPRMAEVLPNANEDAVLIE